MATKLYDKKVSSISNEEEIVVTLGVALPPVRARARGAHEITVKDAFLSMFNQSFDKEKMEIIVVHDGSSERTLSIINEIASNNEVKIKFFTTDQDSVAIARQTIVDNSTGKFIIFIDSDMVLPKDFVRKQVEMITMNKSIGVVGANMKGKLKNSMVAKLEAIAQAPNYEFGVLKKWRRNPRKLGTGGSIFRRDAIKEVGGFDLEIKGAGEDSDITGRIKSAGYSLLLSQAEFEHEFKQNFKSLWNQLVWYGYGSHYLYHKNRDATDLIYTYFFPVSFGGGIVRAILSFRAKHRKISFLLPFYNLFKSTAWWFGFFKASLEGYKPKMATRTKN
jgi:cellulose synthase/poly-beta-1,6-N-acetylglucosamine synthase-like glycosyltransferase